MLSTPAPAAPSSAGTAAPLPAPAVPTWPARRAMPEDVRRLLAVEPTLQRYLDTHAQACARRAVSTWSLLGRTWDDGQAPGEDAR